MAFDPYKNIKNLRDHKIDLSFGNRVLADCHAIEVIDEKMDYGEERWNVLGMVDGAVYHLTYTENDDGIRYISLRPAEKREEAHYLKEVYRNGRRND